ncbi:DNA repair helicase (Rad3), partial [Paramicrosporidium saccamoebae]
MCRACPYYMARGDLLDAELVLMPYNYLVDRKTAQTISTLDLTDAIVIFDEAHNVESTCGEASSTDISTDILAQCVKEVEGCLNLLKTGTYVGTLNAMALESSYATLMRIRAELERLPLNADRQLLQRGEFIIEFLRGASVTEEKVKQLLADLEAISRAYLESEFTKKQANISSSLQLMAGSLRTIFKISSAEEEERSIVDSDHRYFRVFAEAIESTPGRLTGSRKTISYWCFNPGIALRALQKRGIYSILLTSGTLSPLASFAAELQIPFPHQLENSHVIGDEQIFCSVVPKGPHGGALNSSFQQRNSDSYRTELGQSVWEVCKIVPDGVLVFFPSYAVMEQCLTAWRLKDPEGQSSIYERIAQLKHPVTEPRSKGDLGRVMDTYYRHISNGHGSIFFAVCRGKVSEGLDFADRKGRAVIVTGIPYPPLKDPRVQLKRQYLNDLSKEGSISGDEWYNQQAARAVNQAIGRVIRHRHDYGAILLFDDRFASPRTIGQLSKWLRPHVKVNDSFAEMRLHLTNFFDHKRISEESKRLENEANKPVEMDNSLFRHFEAAKETMEETRSFFDTNRVTKQNLLIPKMIELENNSPTVNDAFVRAFSVKSGNVNPNNAPPANIQPASIQPSAKTEKHRQAQIYLEVLKSRLGKDATREFNSILKAYRGEQIDIRKLVLTILGLFEKNQAEDLVVGFRDFISNKHLELFDQLVSNRSTRTMTTSSIGKRPLDIVPDMTLPAPQATISQACPICTETVNNGYRAKCGHVMLEGMRRWCRELANGLSKRLNNGSYGEHIPFLRYILWQRRIPPTRVWTRWNPRPARLPFAGRRLGVSGLGRFFQERLQLLAGYIPARGNGPTRTFILTLTPPQIDTNGNGRDVVARYVRETGLWSDKMMSLLAGLDSIDANSQFISSTQLKIQGDAESVATMIARTGLVGIQAQIIPECASPVYDAPSSPALSSVPSLSSVSCL